MLNIFEDTHELVERGDLLNIFEDTHELVERGDLFSLQAIPDIR